MSICPAPQCLCTATISCSPCAIPAQNLTLSWTNLITGPGSVTLVYTATPAKWESACSNGLTYLLTCTGGELELRVIYYTVGSCPTGTSQYCSNLRASPYQLVLASYTCSPFSATWTSASSGCPAITGSGYTQFVVNL